MLSSKPWLIAFAFLIVFALGANSASATSYIRGYVKPSGDGPNDCTTNSNCVHLDSGNLSTSINVDLFGVIGTQTFSYDVLSYSSDTGRPLDGTAPPTQFDDLSLNSLNIASGETLTFVFASGQLPPMSANNITFGIVPCGPFSPGQIVDSGFPTPNVISTNCTSPTSNPLIAGETDFANSVSFTIGATPTQFAFGFPHGVLPIEIDLSTTPVSTPEPASLSLLAVGLIGLGVFRRKRVV